MTLIRFTDQVEKEGWKKVAQPDSFSTLDLNKGVPLLRPIIRDDYSYYQVDTALAAYKVPDTDETLVLMATRDGFKTVRRPTLKFTQNESLYESLEYAFGVFCTSLRGLPTSPMAFKRLPTERKVNPIKDRYGEKAGQWD